MERTLAIPRPFRMCLLRRDGMRTAPNSSPQLTANLRALAEGDLTFDPILKEADENTLAIYQQYKEIGFSSLVQARDSIRKLVSDGETLTKAAVEGKLSTRVDASKHQGDYQKVVQGINDTLDAVIVPINEAMRIADSYANGDLTARVEIETQGDLTRFSQSLNKIGESL